MNFKLVCAMALGAALLATGPAQAAKCTKDSDCSVGQVCSLGTCKARSASSTASSSTSGSASSARIAWGDIGFYDVSGSGAFGLNVGTAVNVTSLTPDIPLALWGNVGLAFPTGGTYWPLTAGAAVRFDKQLPVSLLFGLGLTIVPNSGGVTTPVGLALQGMAFLPLPQVSPNFSANVQIAEHILSSSLNLFTLTFGGSLAY